MKTAAMAGRRFLLIVGTFSGMYGLKLGEALLQQLFEVFEGLREAFNSLLQLVGGHAICGVHLDEGGFVD